jgi:hypothetical protein
MAIPSGIAAQLGFKTEVTYGTAVTVDSFIPIVKETIKFDIDRIKSNAIRTGRTVRDAVDWMPGKQFAAGGISLELDNVTMQKLFTHAFGAVVTTGSNPYTHTFTPTDMTAKGLTVQIGLPSTDGTVRTKTYAGTKIKKLSISAKAGDLAMLDLDVVAQSEVTNVGLASASFTSGINPYTFIEGSLSIGGSSIAYCKDVKFDFENALADDRFMIGAATFLQPLQNDLRGITGTATLEFADLTQYTRYVAGTTAALVLAFSDGANSLTITLNVFFNGETPTLDGRDIITLPLGFEAVGTTDAAACTVAIINTDSSAA